jgi:glycerol-3-phosphate dehydrogenase
MGISEEKPDVLVIGGGTAGFGRLSLPVGKGCA